MFEYEMCPWASTRPGMIVHPSIATTSQCSAGRLPWPLGDGHDPPALHEDLAREDRGAGPVEHQPAREELPVHDMPPISTTLIHAHGPHGSYDPPSACSAAATS